MRSLPSTAVSHGTKTKFDLQRLMCTFPTGGRGAGGMSLALGAALVEMETTDSLMCTFDIMGDPDFQAMPDISPDLGPRTELQYAVGYFCSECISSGTERSSWDSSRPCVGTKRNCTS
jgi:hypothetical protein